MEEVVMRAAFKKMMDERDKAEAERDAARADSVTLHKMLDETVIERDTLRTALADALDWLENAPINYANGNVHDGMDEGDVLGGRYHEKLTAQLRAALNLNKVVREFPVGEFANNDHQ